MKKILLLIVSILLLSSMINIGAVNLDADDREFVFEGITWEKTITGRVWQDNFVDLYDLYKDKITWSTDNGELTVEETLATYNVFVGVSMGFLANDTGIAVSLDSMNTAGYSGAQDYGILAHLYRVNADGSLSSIIAKKISNVGYYTSNTIYLNRTISGENYRLMIYYSDAWTSDYNQKIFFKNFDIQDYHYEVSPEEIRNITFEDITWMKEVRSVGETDLADLFEDNMYRVGWTKSRPIGDIVFQMEVEEVFATDNAYVGVSMGFLANETSVEVSMDSMNTASDTDSQSSGVNLGIFTVNIDGTYNRVYIDTVSDLTSYTTNSLVIPDLIVGEQYRLMIMYDDVWSADLNQIISFRNFDIQDYTPPGPRTIDFEGITWKKEIRTAGQINLADLYEDNKDKVAWSNDSGELTIEEDLATDDVYVGVSMEFLANDTGITVSMDSMNTAGHSTPQSYGVRVAIFSENSDGTYDRIYIEEISDLTYYTSNTLDITGLTLGEQYHLMILYEDWWSTDYNQKIYFKNFDIQDYTPVVIPPGDTREIIFEGITWEKTITGRLWDNNFIDLYDDNEDKVTWSTDNGELTAEETLATYQVYVGVSMEFLANETGVEVSMDSKNTASHSSPQDYGIIARVYSVNTDGTLSDVMGEKISMLDYYTYNTVSLTGLVPGEHYRLMIYYSDGWSTDYNQKIFFKNFEIQDYTYVIDPDVITLDGIGYDIYQLSDVRDESLSISLESEGPLNMFLSDTDFYYSIITAMLNDVDSVTNPHNLVDTYYSDIKTINYNNNKFDTLWLVVYSIDVVLGYSVSDTSYKLVSSFDYTKTFVDTDSTSNLPNKYTGTIFENGDEYWDSNEADFISFDLDAGEVIDVYFDVPYGELILMFFDGSSLDDIEESLGAALSAIENGYSLPSGVYYLGMADSSALYFSYAPNSAISGNMVVFTYNSYNPSSMSYSILTSVASGTNNDDTSDSIKDSPDSELPGFTIAYAPVLVIATIVLRKRKK